ncbi:hypothetical protein D3C76_1875790 [compost metagenome]
MLQIVQRVAVGPHLAADQQGHSIGEMNGLKIEQAVDSFVAISRIEVTDPPLPRT